MGTVHHFEDLKISQLSRVLVREIYCLMKVNKAYGFLDISKSRCGEVRSMLYLAEDLMYVDKGKAAKLREDCKLISASIANMTKTLKY